MDEILVEMYLPASGKTYDIKYRIMLRYTLLPICLQRQ